VPILVLANLALVLDLLAGVGFLMSKQTRYATPLVGLQFTLAMALNWALVPRIGPMGAALASLISLTAMVGLKFAVAQRYYPIPYDWKRILGFLVIAVGVGMVTQGLVQALDPSLIAGLVVKLVGLGLYVLAAGWLVLGRITTQKMAATLQQIVSLVQQT
jgi:O-antigen/teichoic acid export membrane protein